MLLNTLDSEGAEALLSVERWRGLASGSYQVQAGLETMTVVHLWVQIPYLL